MKFILLVSLLISSFSALAAEVLSAKLDANNENLLVDVQYTGGCAKHTFSLKVGESCLETYPVQCSAKLIETVQGSDTCEVVIQETAVFNLKKLGLTDVYFEGASLAISGGRSITTGQPSRVLVKLP